MDGLTPLDQLDALGLTEAALTQILKRSRPQWWTVAQARELASMIRALAQPTPQNTIREGE